MLTKVISGGQTGADVGGLIAAKACRLQTGGTMPKGYKTLDGCCPVFAAEYNMEEHSSDKYPPRTYKNVKESDGTLRIAVNFDSTGEVCTLKAIKQYKKPFLDIDVRKPPKVMEVVEWLRLNEIKVLNVAGNSEKTCPGIKEWTVQYLTKVFRQLADQFMAR